MATDTEGYGRRPGQNDIARLLEDARTVSLLGAGRPAGGWTKPAGGGTDQSWHDAERDLDRAHIRTLRPRVAQGVSWLTNVCALQPLRCRSSMRSTGRCRRAPCDHGPKRRSHRAGGSRRRHIRRHAPGCSPVCSPVGGRVLGSQGSAGPAANTAELPCFAQRDAPSASGSANQRFESSLPSHMECASSADGRQNAFG